MKESTFCNSYITEARESILYNKLLKVKANGACQAVLELPLKLISSFVKKHPQMHIHTHNQGETVHSMKTLKKWKKPRSLFFKLKRQIFL